MQHERYVGYEIKALSNLLRRRLWGPADHPQSMLTEIEGVLIGYLCHSQGREIYQKELEQALCIRRPPAPPSPSAAPRRAAAAKSSPGSRCPAAEISYRPGNESFCALRFCSSNSALPPRSRARNTWLAPCRSPSRCTSARGLISPVREPSSRRRAKHSFAGSAKLSSLPGNQKTERSQGSLRKMQNAGAESAPAWCE